MRSRIFVRPSQRSNPVAEILGEWPRFGMKPGRKSDQARNHREDILDAVTELAAEDFILFRLALAFVNVGAGPDPADNLAGLVPHWCRTAERPAVFAAAMPQPILDLIW